MRHSVIIAMAALAILPATAQLRVINNGGVQVGNYAAGGFTPANSPERAGIVIPSIVMSDTTATLGINGTGNNLSGGKLSFGVGNVNIQEFGIGTGSSFSTLLRLNSKGGFMSYCGDNQIFIYNSKNSTNAFTYEKGSVLDVGNSDGYNK